MRRSSPFSGGGAAADDGGATLLVPAGLLLAVAAAVAAVEATSRTDYQLWGALVVLPGLALVTVPLLRRVARAEDDRGMARLVGLALLVKLGASAARYVMAFGLYGGRADADAYGDRGADLAALFRDGALSLEVARDIPGTGVIDVATGVVFTATGATLLGAFLVFAWVAFWGQYLFYRAFRLALPGGDHRRYALLVLFLPSLLFWPASVGKEAWMLFVLGLTAYGAAQVLMHRRGGYQLVALGVFLAGLVRPHMAALALVSLLFALLLGKAIGGADRSSAGLFAVRVAGVVLLVAGTAYALQQVQAFFDVEGLAGLEAAAEDTEEQTTSGGSAFEPTEVRSLVDVPAGAATVLFRPWPFEAHNPQAMLSSLEGLVLLGLMAAGRRRILGAVRDARARPYLLLALLFVAMFIVAFSHVGNFGILARQRVQLLPFVAVLLAYQPVARDTPERPPPRRRHVGSSERAREPLAAPSASQ